MGMDRTEVQAMLLDLKDQMANEFPGFEILEKRVWWWWLAYYAGLIFLWSPNFMETVWTTVGRKVYIPHLSKFASDDIPDHEMMGDYSTLWHERRHMLDLKALLGLRSRALRSLVWFSGYFAPQILATGVVGALWTPWAWLCLVFLGPWPAPFRVWAELRGYRASAEAWIRMTGEWNEFDERWLQKRIDRNFVGWRYYRMAWNRKRIEKWLRNEIAGLRETHGIL